jgi:hypothetical protein
MATLKILEFPSQWNGTVNCSGDAYVYRKEIVGEMVRCVSCGYQCDGKTRQVCSCHTYCTLCDCGELDRSSKLRPLPEHVHAGEPPAGLTFHPYKIIQGAMMEHVIEPYCNVAVTNDEANLIMSDVTKKLNGYDSNNGLGVLHSLLVYSDNVDLLMKLLELGVDPELRFVHLPGSKVLHTKEVRKDLNGGTALHFAVRFGRAQCFKALVDAGANLEARTAAGTRINGFVTSSDMKEVIVSFLLKMYSKAS